MAVKTKYKIIGRFMSGKEVTGYILKSSNGNTNRYSREQVAFLVGRGQVINCDGQIYKDKLLLRGVGISLDDLPVQYETNTNVKNSDNTNTKDDAIMAAVQNYKNICGKNIPYILSISAYGDMIGLNLDTTVDQNKLNNSVKLQKMLLDVFVAFNKCLFVDRINNFNKENMGVISNIKWEIGPDLPKVTYGELQLMRVMIEAASINRQAIITLYISSTTTKMTADYSYEDTFEKNQYKNKELYVSDKPGVYINNKTDVYVGSIDNALRLLLKK